MGGGEAVKNAILPAGVQATLVRGGKPRPSSPNQHQKAGEDAAQRKEANLPITHLRDLQERPAPQRRCNEGHKPLKHQHQGAGKPKAVAPIHDRQRAADYLRGAAGAVAALPPLRMALKNSEEDGSTTITSLFLLKLALYASRLR